MGRRRDCPTTDTTGIRHPSRAAVNGPPRCRAPSLPRRAKGCGAPSPPRSAQRGPRDPCAGESTIYHKDVAAGEPAPPRRRSRHSSRATSAATSEHVRWRRGVPVGHASITPSTDIMPARQPPPCRHRSKPNARATVGGAARGGESVSLVNVTLLSIIMWRCLMPRARLERMVPSRRGHV